MKHNLNTYFKDDQIKWLDNNSELYKRFNMFGKTLGLKQIKFGLFKSDDFNAYAFEDIEDQHTVLLAEDMPKVYSTQELDAIVLHELGHLKHKHISYRMMITNLSQTTIISMLILLFLKFSTHFNIIVGLVFVFFASWPLVNISKFMSLMLDQFISRKCEYEADFTAIQHQGTPIHIMRVLVHLEKNEENTSLWKSFINKIKYEEPDWLKTHPHIDKRLNHAESFIFKLKK